MNLIGKEDIREIIENINPEIEDLPDEIGESESKALPDEISEDSQNELPEEISEKQTEEQVDSTEDKIELTMKEKQEIANKAAQDYNEKTK